MWLLSEGQNTTLLQEQKNDIIEKYKEIKSRHNESVLNKYQLIL